MQFGKLNPKHLKLVLFLAIFQTFAHCHKCVCIAYAPSVRSVFYSLLCTLQFYRFFSFTIVKYSYLAESFVNAGSYLKKILKTELIFVKIQLKKTDF